MFKLKFFLKDSILFVGGFYVFVDFGDGDVEIEVK